MTTVADTDHTGELGVLALRKMCAKTKQICREVLFRDVGVDAFIELVDGGVAQGLLVGVQVKSGTSFVHGDIFGFTSDINHAWYWSLCAFPMIGLVHDPATERSVWIDLTGSCTPDRFEKDNYRFEADYALQPLDEGTLINTVIPLVRKYFGRTIPDGKAPSLEPRPEESAYETWFRLIGVLVGPATSVVDAADAAQRLSRHMPAVNADQKAAVAAVVDHLSDFQLLKLVSAADHLIGHDSSFSEHVVDLLAYGEGSSERLAGLLRNGAVPDELHETAVQLVESLTQEERNDLRKDPTPLEGAP
ncbi:MAG: DUF4365 domain-containing protein [Polyangiaceae bacterium]|nr:DUF4365 domain-containing protein [Polyangiaceae bacterium]